MKSQLKTTEISNFNRFDLITVACNSQIDSFFRVSTTQRKRPESITRIRSDLIL